MIRDVYDIFKITNLPSSCGFVLVVGVKIVRFFQSLTL